MAEEGETGAFMTEFLLIPAADSRSKGYDKMWPRTSLENDFDLRAARLGSLTWNGGKRQLHKKKHGFRESIKFISVSAVNCYVDNLGVLHEGGAFTVGALLFLGVLDRFVGRGDIELSFLGAYWFRPGEYARGGMPRMVRWPRKKSNQKIKANQELALAA